MRNKAGMRRVKNVNKWENEIGKWTNTIDRSECPNVRDTEK